MRFTFLFEQRFPVATTFIRNVVPTLMDRERELEAFCAITDFSREEVRQAVTPGRSDPLIGCRQLIGASGQYRHKRVGGIRNRFVMDPALPRLFEKAVRQKDTEKVEELGFGLYLVTVHEMVHWATAVKGSFEPYPMEFGELWEKKAFDQDISVVRSRFRPWALWIEGKPEDWAAE